MHKSVLVISDELNEAYRKVGLGIVSHPKRMKIISSSKQYIQLTHDNIKMVSLLTSGEIELCNSHNNLIIANVYAPAILGLSSIFLEENYFNIKSVSNIELIMIPLSDFIAYIDRENLWREVSMIFSYYLNIYYVRDLLISQSNVYNIIKDHLEILWYMSSNDSEYHSGVSVFDFILNRTSVSRSSLNKVLKDLTSGGYIEMRRGKLVSLKKLPTGY